MKLSGLRNISKKFFWMNENWTDTFYFAYFLFFIITQWSSLDWYTASAKEIFHKKIDIELNKMDNNINHLYFFVKNGFDHWVFKVNIYVPTLFWIKYSNASLCLKFFYLDKNVDYVS